MKLHEATVQLLEQPTNKKRRNRVKQAFEALGDGFTKASKTEAGGFTWQNLNLPEFAGIAHNLDRANSMLAQGLPAQFSKVQQRFQSLAALLPATSACGSGAPQTLQHPANSEGELTKFPPACNMDHQNVSSQLDKQAPPVT